LVEQEHAASPFLANTAGTDRRTIAAVVVDLDTNPTRLTGITHPHLTRPVGVIVRVGDQLHDGQQHIPQVALIHSSEHTTAPTPHLDQWRNPGAVKVQQPHATVVDPARA
jgi:hypothetical protein